MKILITNAVPLNGGDEALLRATIDSLKQMFPKNEIKILCSNLVLCRRYLPDLDFDSDLEYSVSIDRSFIGRIKSKLKQVLLSHFRIKWYSTLSMWLSSSRERKTVNLYKNSDLVLSSAGGYIHDHYPVNDRLRGFELALDLEKPLVIFAQSIGPFWKEESKVKVKEIFNRIPLILLRENISRDHLNEIGVNLKSINVTTDVAFLYRKLNPELFVAKNGEVKSIAMCFRHWPVTLPDSEIIEKAIQLCVYLLKDNKKRITFISTCQGIKEYVDDSIIADLIIDKLPIQMQARCTVNRKKYSPTNLISQFSQFDAYIGMRLHGAILAMLGGTPAMAIGYEDKTEGVFIQMGMNNFHVNYNKDISEWKKTYDAFIDRISEINKTLPRILDNIAEVSQQNITQLKMIVK